MRLLHHIFTGLMISGLIFLLPLNDGKEKSGNVAISNDITHAYHQCGLDGKLDYNVFENAMECLDELEFNNERLLTIIDFTKPSTEKRLFIIDLNNQELIHHTLVAHGKNTGLNVAENFSNTSQSLQSSLGFYNTGEPYYGKHGYSLRLDGLEKGINNNARKRAIVIHGAKYVSEDFIENHGRLGRSWGCPALPVDQTKEIIDLIKKGTCLYIYSDDKDYLENSVLSD